MARRLILAILALAVLVTACEPTGERRLVSLREGDLQPGHLEGQLLYAETRGVRQSVLYIHDVGTDQREQIRGLPEGYKNSPAWSPDGQRVAFSFSGEDGFSHIWAADADGSNLRQITRGEVLDDGPRWSPDGEQIVFSSIRDGVYFWRLFVIPASGGEPEQIGPSEGHSVFPDWSPDGRVIAYSHRDGDHYDLHLLDLETGADRRVTESDADDRNARFAPDGSAIVFSTNRVDDVWQLFELDLATERLIPVIGSDTMDEWPTYSPDMEHVAMASGHLAIYRADGGPLPDGQWRWQVTLNLAWAPDWRPDPSSAASTDEQQP